MSWQTPSSASEQAQGKPAAAVLDMNLEEMEILEDNDPLHSPGGSSEKSQGSLMDDMRQRMGENVTQYFFQAGTQGAKKAWSVYGNIDILRPYFDVEPKEVQMRLLYSLIPIKTSDLQLKMPRELYGPTMLVLTLIALLLYQMKTAEHRVEEGTLIGSAFGVCFMYWLGASSTVWFVSYVCNVRVAALQILSMIGYALFGHCIVLFLGTVIHTSHDHIFFYILWAVVGGLSTMRMATLIMSRTRGQKERMLVIGTVAALHLLFLLYLHFAYHTIVEEISDALNENLAPLPASEAPQVLKDLNLNNADAKVVPQVPTGITERLTVAVKGLLKERLSVVKEGANATGTPRPRGSLLLAKLGSPGGQFVLRQ